MQQSSDREDLSSVFLTGRCISSHGSAAVVIGDTAVFNGIIEELLYIVTHIADAVADILADVAAGAACVIISIGTVHLERIPLL